MAECALTELDVTSCAHCRKLDLPTSGITHWFFAQWPGVCAGCYTTFSAGQRIAAGVDGESYYCKGCVR